MTKPQVIKRNGSLVDFDEERIYSAICKAFNARHGAFIPMIARNVTGDAVSRLQPLFSATGRVGLEDIQDAVVVSLRERAYPEVAEAYQAYRKQHAEERAKRHRDMPTVHVKPKRGEPYLLDMAAGQALIAEACAGLQDVSVAEVFEHAKRNVFDGMTEADLDKAMVLSARCMIERDPNYSYVTARLLLRQLYGEACRETASIVPAHRPYDQFNDYLVHGVELGLLDSELLEFDLDTLKAALKPERDLQFTYLGLQTLYDRYFLQREGNRFELPQAFFMRVAMGLALNEPERERRAIEFYEVLSSFDFMSSTPTLFNSGTLRPQLSSCYLTTVPDDLRGIFGAIQDNALLSKYAGGLGNDWTRVRAMGAHIKGTNGKSQGVVPFLKVANDTAVAVNQGGRRKGAVCAYLQTWHLDIEEFLELRKNTGDDRRRTHDMNTANFIPDLFMQRVEDDAEWTLFSPDDVLDLHDLYGEAFAKRYAEYEAKAAMGEIAVFKKVPAVALWRKMLTMVFETGHPWIAFKDPCNIRSPQQHVGVVHSSNLCTEITLNTSDDEVSVCNLGSINMANHITADGKLDVMKMEQTIQTAMRMLDNVIDINFYPVIAARRSNERHRPVGLGMMGFQDAMYKMRLCWDEDAEWLADMLTEAFSYHAIKASQDLAVERGRYPTFEGSLWDRGVLPIDTIKDVAWSRRGGDPRRPTMDTTAAMDWGFIRRRMAETGMRNSNCMAIAPTATIANICGVTQSIEPTYQNLYVKSNLSGEFTVVNPYLVADLKARGLWDEAMVNDLKRHDGSVQAIERVPADLKALYATAFEIDPEWLVRCGSRRQKWIDQAQSLNLYMREPSGKKLDELYRLAWSMGLKTTYYLRSQGATHVDKSTVADAPAAKACLIDDPECEACQ